MNRVLVTAVIMLLSACTSMSTQESAVVEQTTPPVKQPEVKDTRPVLEVPYENILFAFDSYEITADQTRILKRWAEYINQADINEVSLHGHADEIGTQAYNMELSKKRAQAVLEELRKYVKQDISIHLHAYGETQPINGNETEQQRQKNRRVEFEIKEERVASHPFNVNEHTSFGKSSDTYNR